VEDIKLYLQGSGYPQLPRAPKMGLTWGKFVVIVVVKVEESWILSVHNFAKPNLETPEIELNSAHINP